MELAASRRRSAAPWPRWEQQATQALGLARLFQDRATFRRLIVKNNAKKRRMYETFIESVPLLKSLEVRINDQFCLSSLFLFTTN